MDKWKIILAIYCGAVLYVSSMSPGEIPDAPVKVSDKALHLVEYAIMGILAKIPIIAYSTKWSALSETFTGASGISPGDIEDT